MSFPADSTGRNMRIKRLPRKGKRQIWRAGIGGGGPADLCGKWATVLYRCDWRSHGDLQKAISGYAGQEFNRLSLLSARVLSQWY